MKLHEKYFLLTGFLIFFSGLVFAQESQVEVKTFASPTRITVGDEIKLTVKIDRPKKFIVTPPSTKISIVPFELKRVETLPAQGKNRVKDTFVLVLTVFDVGDFKVPPIPFKVDQGLGKTETVLSDPIAVKVVNVPKRVSDKDDIRPIKDPISLGLKAFWNWFLGLLAFFLAAGLVARAVLRRLKANAVDPESLMAPHERVRCELDRLKEKGYLHAGLIKEFYSELYDILRRYLERSFKFEALESTTPEILSYLKQKEIGGEVVVKIKELLEQADLVKFAKFIPPRSLADRLEADLLRIVDLTKPKEEAVKP